MHRIDGPGATIDNEFTEGNPATAVPATVVTDDWLNDVQEELISILTAAAVTPVKGTQNQVLNAIVPALLASIAEAQGLVINTKILTPGRLADAFKGSNVSLAANGYQKLPSGLIIQWGSIGTGGGGSAVVTFPIAFPTGQLQNYATLSEVVPTALIVGSDTGSPAQMTVYASTTAGAGAAGVTIKWASIGY